MTERQPLGDDLLVARHLVELEEIPLGRRIWLGWFAAQWLARGLTVAALSDELGVARQTGYRWMCEISEIFGSKLYKPAARLELQAALGAALPRWQTQGAADPIEPGAPGAVTVPGGLLSAGPVLPDLDLDLSADLLPQGGLEDLPPEEPDEVRGLGGHGSPAVLGRPAGSAALADPARFEDWARDAFGSGGVAATSPGRTSAWFAGPAGRGAGPVRGATTHEAGGTEAPVSGASVSRLFYPVVAVDHVLGDAPLTVPGARSTGTPGELLVPAATDPESLVAEADGGSTLVYGPEAPTEVIGESLRLTRRAAELLGQRREKACGGVVSVADLTGELIAVGTPLLTRFAIDRHLDPMIGLPSAHRLPLAEALLEWLSTADPANRIAQRIGVAVNTVYSRLQRARRLLGEEALSDPYQRLEITVALRAMVPVWREQLNGRG